MRIRPSKIAGPLLVLLASIILAGCQEPRSAMVSTANPHASNAAIEMLEQGGSAVDAAIAAQLVLTLTEPQSSGIGGGLFMLHWDAKAGEISAIDGRETAPDAAGADWFLNDAGEPMGWLEASKGGRPVGVPGVIAALWQAHRDHGKLPWAALFNPAINLARNGFVVSGRLHRAIAASPALLNDTEAAQIYFDESSNPLAEGAVLRNPIYARTLAQIAVKGPDYFYNGPIAAAIVARVNTHTDNPSAMSLEDFSKYKAIKRQALCGSYRRFRVCGMPPPTSGGLTNLMILTMLEPYRMAGLKPNGTQAAHLFTQASRLAFADRARYMADPDHVQIPTGGLLDRDYLRERARVIDPAADMGQASAGIPPLPHQAALHYAPAPEQPEYGTSHLSIIDQKGHAVSMTMSVEQRFGAHIMAGGFVLNNQLTDFSFVPERDGQPIANRPGPGKRPRSSMSPMLIFDENDQLFAAIGSPGGSRIINYVGRTLIALMDWDMTMQEAIDLPRIINRNNVTELELARGLDPLADTLRQMGHDVQIRNLNSGLHGIRVMPDGRLDGGVDRRREGVVLEITAEGDIQGY